MSSRRTFLLGVWGGWRREHPPLSSWQRVVRGRSGLGLPMFLSIPGMGCARRGGAMAFSQDRALFLP